MADDRDSNMPEANQPLHAEEPTRLATFEQYRGLLFSIAYRMLTLDSGEGRIRALYIMANPEKLSRLPELPAAPC